MSLVKLLRVAILRIEQKMQSIWRLESSANVQGIKKSLVKKDIIDIDGTVISFNDPIFKLWIKRNIPNL